MRIGVSVSTATLPPASSSQYNTGAGFMVGRGDNGAPGTAYKCFTVIDVANAIGARSATNSVLYDAADTYFREGGGVLYLSRVVGLTPVSASLTLQDTVPHPTVVVTAKNPGPYGNTLKTVVNVVGGNYTVLVQDSNANTLETWGPFPVASGNAPLLAVTSNYVAFTQSAGAGFTTAAPAALVATALTGGVDNYGSATITQWQNALAAFAPTLGPGQVSAPGLTNTTMSGIWSALGLHAQNNNRVAACDMDDGQTATTLISALGAFGASGVGTYCGFWAGSVLVPGVTPGTTRTVAASAVISALCARADQAGNPNLAAAGSAFPLKYATGFLPGVPYSASDIDALSLAGINTWNTVFNVNQNYGFESPVPQTTDTIFWQFNHARLRMALVALFQVVGQPFVFSQLTLSDIAAFSGDLAQGLSTYVLVGAISTLAPDGTQDQGFVVDTGPAVNTATTMAAGQLNANVSVRFTPFAQLVQIQINSVPTTQQLGR